MEVQFRLLIQWEVNQWMQYSDHARRQALIQSNESFFLRNLKHCSKHIGWISSSVILLTGISKDFSLHACANHPKRIRYDITSNSSNRGRQGIKVTTAFFPLQPLHTLKLYALIQRKVQSVEKRRAEGTNVVTAKQASNSFIYVYFLHIS